MQTTLGQNAKRFVKQPKNLFSLLCFCVAEAFAAQTSCVVMEGDGLLICDTSLFPPTLPWKLHKTRFFEGILKLLWERGGQVHPGLLIATWYIFFFSFLLALYGKSQN